MRKSLFLLFITLISSLLLLECKTQDYTPYDYDGEVLIFGKGGGFTGQSIEYSLLSNGQLFMNTHKEGNVTELKRVEKSVAKQIFSNFHSLGFGDLDVNKPGNTYYYLGFRHDGKAHKIQWGAHDYKTPQTLKIYFSNLMAIVKSLQKDAQ